MAQAETSHDHVTASFARQIAEVLATARNEHRFNRIVLVAEPGFLGVLRGKLDNATASMVTDSVHKDLAHVAIHDLGRHLQDVLAV